MAGVYGEIDGRADFERVLSEARALAAGYLKLQPANAIIGAIDRQLAAMQRATADGRVPPDDERKGYTIGLIAARELDAADPQDDAWRLAQKLFALNVYIEEWPTDEQAAKATDADFWARFGL